MEILIFLKSYLTEEEEVSDEWTGVVQTPVLFGTTTFSLCRYKEEGKYIWRTGFCVEWSNKRVRRQDAIHSLILQFVEIRFEGKFGVLGSQDCHFQTVLYIRSKYRLRSQSVTAEL